MCSFFDIDTNGLRNLHIYSRGGGPGGGMYVGPDHPIFGDVRGGNSDLDDPSRIFGGPQNLPRGAVPPGARFDPIGPFGRLPVRPPPPSGIGRGSGTGGPRNFSGEPDNDELMPPVTNFVTFFLV
jgi:proteasome inhibitor subunit 1 (PI31)